MLDFTIEQVVTDRFSMEYIHFGTGKTPMVVLPATGGEHHSVAEFTWNEFEQEGWSKTYVSVYSVIAKLYGFDFQFATKYSNQTGFFTIYSIGYWGTCNQF